MAAKKSTRSRTKSTAARQTAAQQSARRQVKAVILLAVAILLFLIAVIRGENAWTWLHDVLLGLLSFSAYVLPLVLAFVAVMLAAERDTGSVSARIWESAAFVVMLNSVIWVFSSDADQTGYLTAVSQAYRDGYVHRGGGVLGVLLGYPAERLFGDTGAKIIIILLMVVFFMLVTGTTILAVARAVKKPVERTKESIEQAIAHTVERREAAQKNAIDIDLGEGYPAEEDGRARKKSRRAETAAPAQPDDESEKEKEKDLRVPEQPLPAEQPNDKLGALERAAAAMAQPPEKKPDEGARQEKADTAAEERKIGEEASRAETEASEREAVYRFPPLSLLDDAPPAGAGDTELEMRQKGQLLVNTLKDFGISTRLSDITCGPAVTRYELEPSPGVKISRITGLADDISLRLATSGVRIEAPIPNKAAVGIEVPNKARRTVCLRSLLDTNEFRSAKGKLTVALGQDIEGNAVLADLAKMPHLLIAGTTGSGKSVCTNSMIQSVLFRSGPEEVKLILIDPKKVEFGVYNGIPHLLVPVVTDPRKAAGALSWAVNEMLKRYQMFSDSGVRDITSYNDLARSKEGMKPLPLILIVIDELADLMMAAANEVEDSICRLAQMARAAGMHMVIATQRPSVDVITGLIKANIPSRLALTVASAVDSRTILDAGGAERLLGYGDMLFMPVGLSKPRRVQGCFVTNREIERVIDFLKNSDEEQAYDEEVTAEIDKLAAAAGRAGSRADAADDEGTDDEDEALPQAIEIAVTEGQISTSMLQRKMRFGYARAGRIIDQLERRGIIGPSEGSKPRKVLITRQQWIERDMNTADAPADE